MYGYFDESDSPGVAINNNNFLSVSLVVFSSKDAAEKCIDSIVRLRKRLKIHDNYEFHRSHNTNAIQDAFVQLLSNLDFKFITIAIKKNAARSHATYPKIAELLIREISGRKTNLNISMDANPILCNELRRQSRKMKLHGVKFREIKSHKDDLVQLADYVVSLSTGKARNIPKAAENYRKITKKQIIFVDVRSD